jgi:hypothetical protein
MMDSFCSSMGSISLLHGFLACNHVCPLSITSCFCMSITFMLLETTGAVVKGVMLCWWHGI